MKIKELYLKYLEASKEYQELYERFGNDFENEELEAQLDNYYENNYYPAFTKLIDQVNIETGIEKRIIRKMIDTKEFNNLMNRIA